MKAKRYTVDGVIRELEHRGIRFKSRASVTARIRALRRGTTNVWFNSDGTRRTKDYPPILEEGRDYVYIETRVEYTPEGVNRIAKALRGSRYHGLTA